MSPREIMCGEWLDQEKHLCLQFGEYCQVYEEELPRNRNTPRTLGAVCLGPTHNKQGGFKFMRLTTGAAVTRYGWDPIPIPSSVIARVNRLGEEQPELLVFTDKKGRHIGEDEPTGVDGAEQPGQDKDLEDDVGLDNERSEDEEDLAKEIEIADQVQSEVEDGYQVKADAENAASVPDEEVAPGGEIQGVRRSTRIKFQPKEPYVPSMTGSKYAVATALLTIQDHGALPPDLQRQFCQV